MSIISQTGKQMSLNTISCDSRIIQSIPQKGFISIHLLISSQKSYCSPGMSLYHSNTSLNGIRMQLTQFIPLFISILVLHEGLIRVQVKKKTLTQAGLRLADELTEVETAVLVLTSIIYKPVPQLQQYQPIPIRELLTTRWMPIA